GGDPRAAPAVARRAAGDAAEDRPRRGSAVGGGAGAGRVRRAALRYLGVGPAQAGRTEPLQRVARGLDGAGRAVPVVVVLPMGVAAGGARGRAARAPGDAGEPAADRWPAHVLLPVLRPDGRLLRRAAVP